MNASWTNKGDWHLKALPRTNSDYKGVLVYLDDVNWGSKPFRVFKVGLRIRA